MKAKPRWMQSILATAKEVTPDLPFQRQAKESADRDTGADTLRS